MTNYRRLSLSRPALPFVIKNSSFFRHSSLGIRHLRAAMSVSAVVLGALTRSVNIVARVIAQQLTGVLNIPAHARIGRHPVDHGETKRHIRHDAPLPYLSEVS